MKRNTLVPPLMAGAMALAIALGGCGGQQQAATTTTEQPAATEQKAEPAQKEAAKESTAQEQATQAAPATQTAAPADQGGQIAEQDAKNIAFADAGVTEQEVTLLAVRLDTDDGVTKYEVEFNVGQTEYDYDIDATTGTILERSSEIAD